MNKCIYCLSEITTKNSSLEHILPRAIGGTLTLGGVCKSCNDFLGHKTDAQLVNHPLINIVRHARQIRSHSNKTPKLGIKDYTIQKPIEGITECKMKMDRNSDGSIKSQELIPRTKHEILQNGHHRLKIIAQSKEEAIEIANKTLPRQGYTNGINSKNLPPPTMKQGKLKAPPLETYILYTNKYKDAILKIAFELAHCYLGKNYLDDITGHILRACIMHNAKIQFPKHLANKCQNAYLLLKKETKESIGFIDKCPNISIWNQEFHEELQLQARKIFIPKNPFFDDYPNHNNQHMAFLKKTGAKIKCYIQIFNVLEAEITVSSNSINYPNFQELRLI